MIDGLASSLLRVVVATMLPLPAVLDPVSYPSMLSSSKFEERVSSRSLLGRGEFSQSTQTGDLGLSGDGGRGGEHPGTSSNLLSC